MSQTVKQSVQSEDHAITQWSNEVRTTLFDSQFRIVETCHKGDRSYEMRHWRSSKIRWQDDGSVILEAACKELAPNTGYLDIRSTGYTHITSEHNIILSAKGRKKTGGGNGGSEEEKSLELYGNGDIHITSDGKGGVYVTSAKNIDFFCHGDMIFKAGGQISMNTGAKENTPAGLSKGIGSGKFVISTGSYELATSTYKESVTGSRFAENNGEVLNSQNIALTEPTLPNQHITTTDTVGSLVHKVGHDYVLEVDGKMLVKINNNPLKKGGALSGGGTYGVQTVAEVRKIGGGRTTTLTAAKLPPYAQDRISIDKGNWYCEVQTAAPGNTAVSAGSLTKGDVVFATKAKGSIGIQAGATPSNVILLQNAGGSIRMTAAGAKGMIQMIATKEISGKAIKINLN